MLFLANYDNLKYFQVESDYLEYFWWKEHYTVHTVLEAKDKAFCSLCEKLNMQHTWGGGYHKPVTSETIVRELEGVTNIKILFFGSKRINVGSLPG